MEVDVLSKMNMGSGLNTREIVDAIVEAQRAPQEELLKNRKEESSVQISSLGTIKSNFQNFKTGLQALDGNTGLIASQSGSAVSLAISDADTASAFSSSITVSQVAAAHTLVFDGFTGANDTVGTGTLSFNFGSWSAGSFSANADRSTASVTISSGADTLGGVRDAINAANINVTASIIHKGDSNYALVLKSREGASHAMQIAASESPAGSGLADLDFQTYDASHEAVAAADSQFTLDGVSVTRETNSITDIVAGYTVTLNSTTSAAETISASHDYTTALAVMQTMVAELNLVTENLISVSKRGLNGEEDGPLAGDSFVRSTLSQLRSVTTDPIYGYGSSKLYLANFGLSTERDGSFTLDTARFKKTYDANPDSFAAIVNSRVTTDSSFVTGSVSGTSWTPGAYAFAISGGAATLDGSAMTLTDGAYSISSGNADGLSLSITGNGANTNIYIGKSILHKFTDLTDTLLAYNSDLDQKITTLNDNLRDYETELSELDVQMEAVKFRYDEQFARMQSAVQSLKQTGESLTSMVEAWKNNK
jgi:flagellar hook-associated protein 2